MEAKTESSLVPHNDGVRLGALKVGNTLLRIVGIMFDLPLFLLPRRGRPVRTKPLHEMHPLAYIDGLRGCCAIMILTAHVMSRAWEWIPPSIIAIPWLQIPFRGGYASLATFFWISGYTVSYKAVGLMQKRNTGQLLDNLSSLAFRRYMRLMLPILPVLFVTTLLVSAGVAEMPESIANDGVNANVKSNPLGYFVVDTTRMLNPFTKVVGWNDGGSGSKLLEHTWSLPAEFRSSMMLCFLCLATCKFSTKNRKTLLLLAVPLFVYWQSAWAAMAWLGVWFAECRHERQWQTQDGQTLLPGTSSGEKRKVTPNIVNDDFTTEQKVTGFSPFVDWSAPGVSARFRKPVLFAVFLYSFVFIQYPHDLENNMSFPHNIINNLCPHAWHAQAKMQLHLVPGLMMMLYPLDHLSELQRPLLMPFCQYLGELSFGIYAVHPTVKWSVWDTYYSPWIADKCGAESMDYFWCAFPGYVVILVCSLWAAEGFRRVDMQVVKLCKWSEERLFEK